MWPKYSVPTYTCILLHQGTFSDYLYPLSWASIIKSNIKCNNYSETDMSLVHENFSKAKSHTCKWWTNQFESSLSPFYMSTKQYFWN